MWLGRKKGSKNKKKFDKFLEVDGYAKTRQAIYDQAIKAGKSEEEAERIADAAAHEAMSSDYAVGHGIIHERAADQRKSSEYYKKGISE